MSETIRVSEALTPEQREQIRKEWCAMNWVPNQVRFVDIRSKRESWFWLKRMAYAVGLRVQPPHWNVTYQMEQVP